MRPQTNNHQGNSATYFKAILVQENVPAHPREALGWEMQPSRAQHPHEVPGDLQGVFISLARKSHTTTTTIPKTFPRHQEPREVGEEQQQQYKPFGTKKVPPVSVERSTIPKSAEL